MFRKILIVAMFATAAGYCFADDFMPQVVTSDVFYKQDRQVQQQQVVEEYVPEEIPAWPIGLDADVEVSCDQGACNNKKPDNIRIVSKIGDDLVVDNNINLGARGQWSGGADMMHGAMVPAGFDNDCDNGSEMPLLHREILEDDGGSVLAVARAGKTCNGRYADDYAAYVANSRLSSDEKARWLALDADADSVTTVRGDISVDVSADAEAPATLTDQVRSWVVASGQTLRGVLQTWCDKEGWDLVWATSREYPIEASAVFKGRFVDVASALVRNFGRATPVPYAKFYKGNRVLVVSTNEE